MRSLYSLNSNKKSNNLQAICYEKNGEYKKALKLIIDIYNQYSNIIVEVENYNSDPAKCWNGKIKHNVKTEDMQLLTEAMKRLRTLLNEDIIYEI